MKIRLTKSVKDFFTKKCVLKRIGAFTTAILISASFAGCHNNDIEENSTSVTTSITEIEDNKEKPIIYSFPLIQHEVKKEDVEYNDWTEAKSFLKDQNENFVDILKISDIPNNRNFECARYQTDDWLNTYVQIVDCNGQLLKEQKYCAVMPLNDCMSVLKYIDKNDNDDINYTLLNHNTGTTMEISNFLTSINDEFFSIYSSFKNNLCSKDLLYYVDGVLAIDKTYEDIINDSKTNKVYLVSEGCTEILNTESKQARKLEGIRVKYAYNNYLICENMETKKEGVYYLDSLEKDLEEKIPMTFNFVSILGKDSNPTFICKEEDTIAVYSTENQKLSMDFNSDNHDYFIPSYCENNYAKVNIDGVQQIINKYGVVISNNTLTNINIVGVINDDLLVYNKGNGDTSVGLMDFEGNILEDDVYDIWEIVDFNDNVHVVLRNNYENETTIYRYDKELLSKGDYSFIEACDIVCGRGEKILSK